MRKPRTLSWGEGGSLGEHRQPGETYETYTKAKSLLPRWPAKRDEAGYGEVRVFTGMEGQSTSPGLGTGQGHGQMLFQSGAGAPGATAFPRAPGSIPSRRAAAEPELLASSSLFPERSERCWEEPAGQRLKESNSGDLAGGRQQGCSPTDPPNRAPRVVGRATYGSGMRSKERRWPSPVGPSSSWMDQAPLYGKAV